MPSPQGEVADRRKVGEKEAGLVPAPHLTSQWSGRPTAQARCSCVAPSLWAAAHRGRCYDFRCQESRREFLTCSYAIFCVIGRAGASKTRRLIMLLSVDWLPPYLCPSGTCLGLGTRVSCSRLTPTRVVPYRGCASSDARFQRIFPLRERTSAMRCLRREGNFSGNGPHKGN